MGFLSNFFKKESNVVSTNPIEESALKGDKKAIIALAQDSVSGINALKSQYSDSEKLKWNKLAAEHGDPESQFNYALILLKGLSFESNIINATQKEVLNDILFWFQKAADKKVEGAKTHATTIRQLLQE